MTRLSQLVQRLTRRKAPRDTRLAAYWSLSEEVLLATLQSSANGLTGEEAARRLSLFGPNSLVAKPVASRVALLWNQLKSPLLLLLIFAAAASLWSGELVDSAIVLVVLAASVGIGYARERSAGKAMEALKERVRVRTRALRDGALIPLPIDALVPGDIVQLAAGSLIPADCVLLEGEDLHVNQAVLTGESFPVEKRAGPTRESAGLAERANCLFLGTNVRSGSARCVVVHTGKATHYGELAQRLILRPPETEFDRGTRHFGYLLTSVMMFMVLGVFGVHAVQGREPMETLLFSVALAVGLSPELLPVILNVNLARGARLLARHGVLVRRLSALENLGSMDVLCTDKTGTLTEGVVALAGAYDPSGRPCERVLQYGALNAALSSGLDNALDEALLSSRKVDDSIVKLAEVPFDFVRKRASVVVRRDGRALLVSKGAVRPMLAVCTRLADGSALDDSRRAEIERLADQFSAVGERVLLVATREVALQVHYGTAAEQELTLEGLLTFMDGPKPGVSESIGRLAERGVRLKMVTGDARAVAIHVASQIGMSAHNVLTGRDLEQLHDEALWHSAETTDIFAEVDPNQKERIILALKKLGHVVGFLGDGVNDAPAMHSADVSLSVDQAVDVAREAADLVLLERSLDVVHEGIGIGRRTLANTMKYILTTTSANVGNMLSMALASLFLPFLPLLPSQILLNNFLSDIPAIGIASDDVDPEAVARPERWNVRVIARFMAEFGCLSSAFDVLTFLLLTNMFHASPATFRTAWFVESLWTELAVALVVRTRRAVHRSRPGAMLLWSTVVLSALTASLPYLPWSDYLGFVPLSPLLLVTMLGVTALYVLACELLKQRFYRRRAA